MDLLLVDLPAPKCPLVQKSTNHRINRLVTSADLAWANVAKRRCDDFNSVKCSQHGGQVIDGVGCEVAAPAEEGNDGNGEPCQVEP